MHCCVVKPGRMFLHRMLYLSTSVREIHYKYKGFHSDLEWWVCFSPHDDDVGYGCQLTFAGSDASGSWVSGAFSLVEQWFQLKLLESWEGYITVK